MRLIKSHLVRWVLLRTTWSGSFMGREKILHPVECMVMTVMPLPDDDIMGDQGYAAGGAVERFDDLSEDTNVDDRGFDDLEDVEFFEAMKRRIKASNDILYGTPR